MKICKIPGCGKKAEAYLVVLYVVGDYERVYGPFCKEHLVQRRNDAGIMGSTDLAYWSAPWWIEKLEERRKKNEQAA